MRTYPSWIAGLRYRGPDGTNRGRYCTHLRSGTALNLVREPDNPHSKSGLAVAVRHKGAHLGYIPSRHHWVGEAMDEGKWITCLVERIELRGLIFRRARFVGLRLTVGARERVPPKPKAAKPPKPKRDKAAEAREKEATDICINGLKILAHIAKSDDDLSAEELAAQADYIAGRLQSARFPADAVLIERILGRAQGLAVPQRAFVRATNIVAKDREHFGQVLAAALRMVERPTTLNETEIAALEKLQAAGKANGWL